jgi:hypothetical protein
MKLNRVIVTMDMKPSIYEKWKRLAEIYDETMNEYLEELIDDACNESWIADELKSK